MTNCWLQILLLLHVCLSGHSIQPIRRRCDVVRQCGRGGGYGFFSSNATEDEKPSSDLSTVANDDDDSAETSSSWGSMFDSWVQQPAKKIYKRTIPWVFGSSNKDESSASADQRHVEQYEIFGMWRLSVNDGDTVIFMEIRPHDLSYGRKHKIAKYKFQSAALSDDENESSVKSKVTALVTSGSTVQFELDGRIYTAKLTRRRIEDEDGRRRMVLKIKGKIYKETSWWWPQLSVGKFAGRKLAYKQLSREEARIWDTVDENEDTPNLSIETAEEESSEEEDF